MIGKQQTGKEEFSNATVDSSKILVGVSLL